eukprot:7809655-Pyramimonas_sp.AAC.1
MRRRRRRGRRWRRARRRRARRLRTYSRGGGVPHYGVVRYFPRCPCLLGVLAVRLCSRTRALPRARSRAQQLGGATGDADEEEAVYLLRASKGDEQGQEDAQ